MYQLDIAGIQDNLSGVVGGCQAFALDLNLLRQVDTLIDNMQAAQASGENLVKGMRGLVKTLSSAKKTFVIDPTNKTSEVLWDLAARFRHHAQEVTDKDSALDRDRQMIAHSDQLDHVHHCVGMLIAAIRDMEEATLELRGALISHDLDSEPRDKRQFDSVEALMKALAE